LPVPLDPEFEALKAAWPRPWPDDEGADRGAFAAARQYATAAEIIAGAKAWAAAADAPKFLPSLAKWLDGRCWRKLPPQRASKGNGKTDLVATGLDMLRRGTLYGSGRLQ
jgi:hypothetical protein